MIVKISIQLLWLDKICYKYFMGKYHHYIMITLLMILVIAHINSLSIKFMV